MPSEEAYVEYYKRRKILEQVISNLSSNIVKVIDEKKTLQLKDFDKNILKLSYGKKKHYLIKIN